MPVRSLLALGSLTLATFVFVTGESLPIGLLGPIAGGLRVPETAVGLLVTGYAGVVVVVTIPLTRWTRRVPRRLLMAVLMGAFVVGTALSAAAGSYVALLSCRVLLAIGQALFWAIVSPAAAAVVAEAVQGRAVAVINGGGALGPVLGVPAGTIVGQLLGWRSAFQLLAALGVVALVGVLATLPSTRAEGRRAVRGSQPDRVRFTTTVLVTGLAVTGAYTVFTYVTPYLAIVTRLPASSDGVVLLVRGLAGFAGAVVVGLVVDRRPWATLLAVVAIQTVVFVVQWTAGAVPVVAVVAVAAAGLALSALASANGARILRYAPGDTAIASAAVSTAFNVGIMLGALLGSAVEAGTGAGAVPLVGALTSGIALLVVIAELRLVHIAAGADAPKAAASGHAE